MLMIKGTACYFHNIIFIVFPFFRFVKYYFSFEHIFHSSLYIDTALYSNVYRQRTRFHRYDLLYKSIDPSYYSLKSKSANTNLIGFLFQCLSNLIIRDFSRRSCKFWKRRKQKKCRKVFSRRLKNSWDIMTFKRQQTYMHTWMTSERKTFLKRWQVHYAYSPKSVRKFAIPLL